MFPTKMYIKQKPPLFRMQKRGLSEQVMMYVLVVVVLGGIAIVGWKMVSGASSRFCKTELADFQLLLGEQAKGLRNGEVMEKSMEVPCGGTNVYLFDAGQKPPSELFEHPVLKDAVASSAAKNVYIMKGDELISSFAVPFLEIPYPYFTCMIPSSGKITFLLQGLGRGASVEPSCLQKNCVVVPERYDSGRADAVLEQAGITERAEIKSSAESFYSLVTVEREYRQCGGSLHMEIRIIPKTAVGPFTYLEAVPACIEEPASQYQNIEEFAPPQRVLKHTDDGGSSPVILSYDTATPLDDQCIEQIKGLAFT
jgi:hypothetical protein